ncbi:MAG: hypothetical protein IPP83_10360 [Flavobacteriales bacterium]|nr:hypothetical protein [Flavobacteriales bacterium]
MIKGSFTVIAVLFAGLVPAQQLFPTLSGETSEGREVTLPSASGKGYTIIGLAYSQKAQPALEEWFEPAYLRFIAKHGLFAGAYQCNVYFVPLFTGMNKAAYEPSMRKFRKSASPQVVDHVVFAKAELDLLKDALGLADKDAPYFFVLDREGRIIHREQGAFTEEKLEAIEEVMLR